MRNPEREAAFEFNMRLADASFRDALKEHGCQNVQDVVVALGDTLVVDVLDRVFTSARPPALVAVKRPSESAGFVFLVVKAFAGPLPPDGAHALLMDDQTTIGMLYDSIPTMSGTTYELGTRYHYSFESVDPQLVQA